jgi:transcriptional regulator with XRE-family HTH domain
MDKRELAVFLRRCRERLDPSTADLPAGRLRRTPGLRREEVGTLAGISTQYYTRLEQARGPHPSREVLAGLTRALRLSDAEREYLHNLVDDPVGVRASPPAEVPDNILDLMHRLPDTAAIVLDAKYDVLACNPLGAALLGEVVVQPAHDRNVLRHYFLGRGPGRRHDGSSGRDPFAYFAAGRLRAATARYPRDEPTQALVAELLANSHEFARLWSAHHITGARHLPETLDQPMMGLDTPLRCDALVVPEHDQTLVLFTSRSERTP